MKKSLCLYGFFSTFEAFKMKYLPNDQSMQGVSQRIIAVCLWLVAVWLLPGKLYALPVSLGSSPATTHTALDAPAGQALGTLVLPAKEQAALTATPDEEEPLAGEEAEKEEEREEKRTNFAPLLFSSAFKNIVNLPVALSVPGIVTPCHSICRRLYIWYAFNRAP